jgi:hypothetical protein
MSETILKGGYSLIEFSSNPIFSTVTEILKLLKDGTKIDPLSLKDEFADGSEASAAKTVKMGIRSADVNDGAGSVYALLKAAEEAQEKLNFRFIGIQNGKLIEDCEDAWNESVASGVTSSADAADKKVGASSAQFVIDESVGGNTILATEIIAVDLSTRKSISYWIKSSVQTNAGDLQILMDNSPNCATPLETLDVPALIAGVWTKCSIALSNPVALNNLVSIGLKMVTDLGACTIHIDDVRGIADNVVLKDIIPVVIFEEKPDGKFNALKVSGVGEADVESNLLELNT